MKPMMKQVGCEQETALLMDTVRIKRLFQKRFDGCRCHKAFPDQIHTFVGRCEGNGAIVACVPEGDVCFPTASCEGRYIIVAVCENVSADYLEYLEDCNISYIFAGRETLDVNVIVESLRRDFGIIHLIMQS